MHKLVLVGSFFGWDALHFDLIQEHDSISSVFRFVLRLHSVGLQLLDVAAETTKKLDSQAVKHWVNSVMRMIICKRTPAALAPLFAFKESQYAIPTKSTANKRLNRCNHLSGLDRATNVSRILLVMKLRICPRNVVINEVVVKNEVSIANE